MTQGLLFICATAERIVSDAGDDSADFCHTAAGADCGRQTESGVTVRRSPRQRGVCVSLSVYSDLP